MLFSNFEIYNYSLKLALNKKNIFIRLKDSIYQGSVNPKDENQRLRLIFKSLFLHLHPPTIDERVIKFNHTFGLGGMAVVLICLQFITGLLLRFFYEPFPGRAYDSIVYLENNVLFGQLLRNIHYWSAVFLIVITFLHLLRVYFTGAFHGKRQFNWVLGIFLLIVILLSNFTGYLLPWDQLSYWAITVSTSMLEYIPLIGNVLKEIVIGGSEIGNATLLIFYNFHTGILPILLILILAFHFWRVRKAGGVIIPAGENKNRIVSTIPNLVAKEFVAAIVLIAFIILISLIIDAPLLDKANPNVSPNPAKAPWYFLGIQELMLHFNPLFSAIIIPLLIIGLLVLLPYFIYDTGENGKWFYSERGKVLAVKAFFISIIVTLTYILLDEYLFKSINLLNSLPDIISNGLIPFIIIVMGFTIYIKYLGRTKKANKNEIIQTIFVFIASLFLVLTLVGIFSRGKGMELTIF